MVHPPEIDDTNMECDGEQAGTNLVAVVDDELQFAGADSGELARNMFVDGVDNERV